MEKIGIAIGLGIVLALIIAALTGCGALPISNAGLAEALEPVIEQLPELIQAATPPGQEQGPVTIVVNFDIDLGQLWGVFRLLAVSTKTDVDIIIVPAPRVWDGREKQ